MTRHYVESVPDPERARSNGAAAVAVDLVETAERDPDRLVAAVLADSRGFDALVHLRRSSPPEWERLCLELKARRVPDLAALKRAVTDAARSAAATATPAAPTLPDVLRDLAGDTVAGDLAGLLDEVAGFLRRFVWFPVDAQTWAAALWVAHTYTADAAETTPRLHITAPDRQCGKSRLLEVLELLVLEPVAAASVTPAVVFRVLAEGPATLLIDEVDTIFSPGADREELRGVLDAGHRRNGSVRRCVGDDHHVEHFSVYGPVALCGIGRLPGTLDDRTIPLALQRKLRSEPIERLRIRRVRPQAGHLRVKLAAWARDALDALAVVDPHLPDELDDRAQDSWEPLMAIADAAGGHWPGRARDAAIRLSTGRDPAGDDVKERLLAAVRDVYADARGDTAGVWSADLCRALREDLEDAPWGSWNDGAGIKPHQVARHLSAYGIRSVDLRRADMVRKGYRRDDLAAAWARYLPENPPGRGDPTSQPLHRYTLTPPTGFAETEAATTPSLLRQQDPSGPYSPNGCSGVAAPDPQPPSETCSRCGSDAVYIYRYDDGAALCGPCVDLEQPPGKPARAPRREHHSGAPGSANETAGQTVGSTPGSTGEHPAGRMGSRGAPSKGSALLPPQSPNGHHDQKWGSGPVASCVRCGRSCAARDPHGRVRHPHCPPPEGDPHVLESEEEA